MDERERRVEKLFQEAADLPAADQEPFVRQHAGGDDALAHDVLELLGHLEGTDEFLESPASGAAELLESAQIEAAPERVGPYRIERLLGRGGWGEVYLARQEAPVQRSVALKILREAATTESAVRRFEAERQALALLDHPGVARIFDAGIADGGRPYFAMEYIPGVPITDFCDQNSATTEERLALFVQVCVAVHHAHQKGVLHRDLKPSNILVRLLDDVPTAVVIDFGLAKALHRPLTESALETQRGTFLGTVEFASPEQILSDGVDVDIRTDVYSLGVLLYMMLSGELPLDSATLRKEGLAGVQRLVSEFEPPTPSRRAASSDSSRAIAKRRRTEPAALAKRLRGDLDHIVLKALEKERGRRYGSAAEFAADIERHLAHEPVIAAPPALSYRVSKAVRRHREAVVAATLILTALVVGAIGSATGWLQALEERDRARDAEASAKEELAISTAVVDHLSDVLSGANPWAEHGLEDAARETRVVDLLDLAAERLAERYEDMPVIRAEVRRMLAGNYRDLGLLREATAQARLALGDLRRSDGNDSPRTMDLASELADLLGRLGEFEEAEQLSREVLAWRMTNLGPNDLATADERAALALFERGQGRYDEAMEGYRAALAVREAEFGRDHERTLGLRMSIAILTWSMGDREGALAELEAVHDASIAALGPTHPDTLDVCASLGGMVGAYGDYDRAKELLTAALDGSTEVLGERHPTTLDALGNLSQLLQLRDELEEAEPLLARAVEINRDVRGAEHPATLVSRMNLALLAKSRGDLERAAEGLQATWDDARKFLGRDNPELEMYGRELAYVVHRLGRLDEAEALFREVLRVCQVSLGASSRDTLLAAANLGRFLVEHGSDDDLTEADELLRNALTAGLEGLAAGDVVVTMLFDHLRALAARTGDAEAAAEYERRGAEWGESR